MLEISKDALGADKKVRKSFVEEVVLELDPIGLLERETKRNT